MQLDMFEPEPGVLDVIWGDGFIRVEPEIPDVLTKALQYWHKDMVKEPGQYTIKIKGSFRKLYSTDFRIDANQKVINFMLTLPGFMHRIKRVLTEAGYRFRIVDMRTPRPPVNLEHAMRGLRDYQLEPAYDLVVSGGGIAACPTGFGKTHLMAAIIRAHSHSDLCMRNTPLIVVTAAEIDLVKKNARDLAGILPDRAVSIGAGSESDDIQVVTAGSLHKINPNDVGILIADEVHTAASDKRGDLIAGFSKALKWGMSATPGGRFDGGDLKTEGLFGPAVVEIPYSKGVEYGALVPISVYFVRCPEPDIPMERYQAFKVHTAKVRWGIEQNSGLNNLLAALMRKIPDSMQTLMIMPHLAQMDHIKERAPDLRAVHAETDGASLIARGMQHIAPISNKERDQIYLDMEAGVIRKIMATYVYKQGVNFPQLEVMICPGGGGSKIVFGQVPGRASRRIDGKDRAYIIDFWHPWDTLPDASDAFDPSEKKKAKEKAGPLLKDDRARSKVYENLGFDRAWVDSISDLPFLKPV